MTGERLQSVLQQDSAEIEGCYRLNDALFKYLVGSGGGEEVLMGFLNSVMDGSRQISALEYLDRERSPLRGEKATRFDVRVRDVRGRIYHVEVQACSEKFFYERCVQYASSSYAEQAKKGGDSEALYPVILIALMDFTCFSAQEAPQMYHWLSFMDRETHWTAPESIEIHTFELPKLKHAKYMKDKRYYPWMEYFASPLKGDDPAMQTIIGSDPALKAAVKREEEFFSDPDLRRAYQQEELRRRNMQKTLESRYEEGLIIGEMRGEARGEARGLARGEAQAKRDMVLKMLNAGMDARAISEISGFTPEQIKALE